MKINFSAAANLADLAVARDEIFKELHVIACVNSASRSGYSYPELQHMYDSLSEFIRTRSLEVMEP